jgi:hypothetical protein
MAVSVQSVNHSSRITLIRRSCTSLRTTDLPTRGARAGTDHPFRGVSGQRRRGARRDHGRRGGGRLSIGPRSLDQRPAPFGRRTLGQLCLRGPRVRCPAGTRMQSAAMPTFSTFEDGRDEPRLRREPDVRDARCAVAGDNTVRALRAPPMPGAPIAGVASGTARVLVTIQVRSARPPGALGTPWRAPVGLDHQPHREEKDELRGAIRAAVVTPDPRGAGRDMTQSYDGAVAAVRAPTVAGFW